MIDPVTNNRNLHVSQEPDAVAPVQQEVANEVHEPPVQVVHPPIWYGFVCDPKTGICTCQAIPVQE